MTSDRYDEYTERVTAAVQPAARVATRRIVDTCCLPDSARAFERHVEVIADTLATYAHDVIRATLEALPVGWTKAGVQVTEPFGLPYIVDRRDEGPLEDVAPPWPPPERTEREMLAAGLEWVGLQGRPGLLSCEPTTLRRLAECLETEPAAAFERGAALGMRVAAAAIEDGEAPW